MGICWCRCNSALKPTPDQEPAPSSINHAGNTSFVGSNISGGSWFSVASNDLATWVSQVSGSFTTIWGNGVVENSQFYGESTNGDDGFGDGPIVPNSNLKAFTLAQLEDATCKFGPNMVLGKGGFGNVYMGWLKEKEPAAPRRIKKTAVAIKRLASGSAQGFREWKSEIHLLGRLSHPNLVKLLGYCPEEEFIIVYEFMKNGSLNYILFGKGSVRPLPWDTRLKVAIGAARGLGFLHSLEKPIIYRDFKSSNILLDEFYNAKISDFGLAFWVGGPLIENTHVSTSVMGTYGYAAPEYIATGNLYVKSDVYSFGVVLVEMLAGLRAFDAKRPAGQQVLVEWVKPYLSNRRKLRTIMDSRLQGKYPPKQASQIAQLAVKCLRPDPQFRPSMKEVVETLEQFEAVNTRPVVSKLHSTDQHGQ